MIDAIETHLFDLLAADARLYQGGEAWAEGWSGVKRVDDEDADDVPTRGYVNLFETAYEDDSSDERPGIYLGMKRFEAQDKLAYDTAAAPPNHTQGRILTIPLVISVHAATKYHARKQRNQLRQNLLAVLDQHHIETDRWYWLEFGGQGGNPADRVWVTATGGGGQQVAEAIAVVPIVISYNWNGSSPA